MEADPFDVVKGELVAAGFGAAVTGDFAAGTVVAEADGTVVAVPVEEEAA